MVGHLKDHLRVVEMSILEEVEKVVNTVRIAKNNYDRVKGLAEASGRGIREVIDTLLNDNINHLEESATSLANSPVVKAIADEAKEHASVTSQEVDGQVYYCQECHHPLDPKEEVEACPNCGAKLEWEGLRKMGLMGWTLGALALLIALRAGQARQ